MNSTNPPAKAYQRIAAGLAEREVWLLVLAGPLLLFPRGSWPWLGLGLIATGWLSRWMAYGHLSVPTRLSAPVSLLAVMLVIGLSIAAVPEVAWPRLWSFVYGLGVFYAFLNWLDRPQRFFSARVLLGLITLGMTGLILVGTDWNQTRLLDLPWLYTRLPSLLSVFPGSGVLDTGELINPRWAGISLGVLLPALVGLWVFGKDPRWSRVLYGAAVIGASVTLLLTQTLHALLGCLAGLCVLLIWRWRWFAVVLLGGLAAGFFAVWLIGVRNAAAFLLSIDNPVGIANALRLDIWSRALAMLQDMPITGIGLNMFPFIQNSFYPGYLLGQVPHAHNIYLQTALDLGLPGLAAFIWLLLVWVITVRRNYLAQADLNYRQMLIGLAGGITAYLAMGLYDGLTLGAKPAPAVWLMLAMGAASPIAVTARSTAGRRRNLTWLIPVLVVILGGLMLLAARPGTLPMNLGALRAQRLLLQTEAGLDVPKSELQDVIRVLHQVVQREPGRATAFERLGRLEALLGNDAAAVAAYEQFVRRDAYNPLRRYYPSEYLLRLLGVKPAAAKQDDLLSIYRQWQIRYPQRAENFLRTSLVLAQMKFDRAGAAQVLQEGLDLGAQPARMLKYQIVEMERQ